jgi:hypothetical protein
LTARGGSSSSLPPRSLRDEDEGKKRNEIMPLLKGKANVGRNIKTEEAAGKPRKQAIAIALNVAGKSRRKKRKG